MQSIGERRFFDERRSERNVFSGDGVTTPTFFVTNFDRRLKARKRRTRVHRQETSIESFKSIFQLLLQVLSVNF